MKRPLVGLAFLVAAGIWLGSVTTWELEWGWVCAAGLIAAFFIFRQARVMAFGLVLVAGAIAYRDATSRRDPRELANVLSAETRRAEVRGVVRSDPTGRQSFFLEVEAARPVTAAAEPPAWRQARGRLYVQLRGAQPVAYGDRVEFSASVRAPRAPRNPGGFDQAAWLARQRVYRVATVWPRDRWEVMGTGHGHPLTTRARAVRDWLETALAAGIEDAPAARGVLAGMVLGERTEIPADTHAAFQATGVFHVFAVSGLHVGLVTTVLVMGLQLLRLPQRWCAAVAIPVLVLYVWATGARPGAVRAMVMACVWLTGWALVRPSDLLNGLGGAALAVLVWEPLQLFDGGFQLSFAVVGTLVLLTPPIERVLFRALAHDPFLPEELWPRWRRWLREPIQYGVRLVAGSTAACVGLVPLMAEYFQLFTPVSVLANVVVVPVLGVIMSVGLLAILTYPVGPVLAEIFNNANYALLLAMMEVVQWISEWPAGHWCVRAPPVWLSAAYYAGLLAAARWPAAWLGLPLLTAALFLPWPPERAVEVTIMDVSRGGAIFVDAPGERADFLVDGSDAAGGARVVVPCLRTAGVDRLAAMVLTRADQNHAAGLSAVAAAVSVERAFHAGLWSRSAAYAEWLADCRRRGIPLEKWRRGVEWGLVRVFHPPPAGAAARSEDQALVLGLEFGPTRVLLVGDASAAVLSAIAPLVQAYRPQVVVQGAGGASWPEFREFLMSVRPEQAVICRPPPTRFHPRRELPDPPVPVWRTDDSGAVKVRLTRSGYRIQTMLPARGTESVRSGSDPRQFALGGRADAHAAGEHPREMKPVGKRQPLGDRLETFVRERESVSGRGNAALEALAIDAGEPDPGRQEMNPPRHQGIVSASPLHTGSVAGGPGRDVAPNAGH